MLKNLLVQAWALACKTQANQYIPMMFGPFFHNKTERIYSMLYLLTFICVNLLDSKQISEPTIWVNVFFNLK